MRMVKSGTFNAIFMLKNQTLYCNILSEDIVTNMIIDSTLDNYWPVDLNFKEISI